MNLTPRKRSYDGSEDLQDIDKWLELSNFVQENDVYKCAVPEWIDEFATQLPEEEKKEDLEDSQQEAPKAQETEEKKPDVEPLREEQDLVGELLTDAQNMGKSTGPIQAMLDFGDDEPT